ncbi:TonB-dependent receptor [Sphingomonas astaxanthinifaciens]|uniref:TonB-dependent receptor n=1 Tax=Sphingomonas astaxanthinifaciens DSM 22298 TaxID=1123267 RepID=A0ABQ5Z965_9SPHN|nr:TonB-dependent receptor [Sphingomonas astaxanthinifaciens]GLR48514.1 TonB-dependent receptor [Sphingomonas astaxanthinifaciens DSM 22298]
MQAVPPPAEIVVTARALPAPAVERLLGVTVIDRAQLRDTASTGLDQILKGEAGLQLFRRSDARSGQPTSQGLTLRALGGNAASRALLVLDGVPQSDPFGGWINWPAYDPSALASVRIVRGGGGVADGPGALAGTIAMESRNDRRVEASLEGGSRGAIAARVYAGTEAGGGTLSLAAYGARGDGFVPITADRRGPADRRSPYENGGGRLRWSLPLGEQVRLDLAASAFLDRRERGLAFTANRSEGEDVSARLVGSGNWTWSALVYGQRRHFEASAASTNSARTTATRSSLQYHVPGRALGWSAELRPPVGEGLELRIGTDGRAARGRSEELGSYVAGLATRDRKSGGKSLTAGAFTELTATEGALTLSGTARIDRWQIRDGSLRETLLATGQVTIDQSYPSRSGWLPTARAAAGLTLAPGLALRTAAYLGWRLPTLNELFRPFRAGQDATAANPALDPERLRGIEAGIDWKGKGLNIALTAFANRLVDPVANVTLAAGPGSFPGVGFVPAGGSYRQRQNLGAITVHGLEANGRWHSGPWSLDGSLSLSRARVRAPGRAAPLAGLRPAQTPAIVATLGGGWSRGGQTATLALRHVGAQYEDDLNRIRLPAATTLDAFGALPIGRSVALFARGENLFDATVVAGRTADGVTERATPRTFWLGIRIGG